MGHLQDLTLSAFAYLRLPLVLAGIAFLVGAIGTWIFSGAGLPRHGRDDDDIFPRRRARVSGVSIRTCRRGPWRKPSIDSPKASSSSKAITTRFHSIFFYHQDRTLILNGRFFVLEYGLPRLDAPNVFIEDGDFLKSLVESERYYLVIDDGAAPRLKSLAKDLAMHQVASAGGKSVYSNQRRSEDILYSCIEFPA